MYGINVTKEFFDESHPASKGLICGLKKLSGMEFYISTDLNDENSSTLLSICRNEGVKFTSFKDAEFDRILTVTTRHETVNSNSEIILVSADGLIKNFDDAVKAILSILRTSKRKRSTNETNIEIEICLDGEGKGNIDTGISFFDHMLAQIVKHANIDMDLKVVGDLKVDEHHTVEDTGIVLGEAINEALGNRKGIKRFGFLLPMDDSVAQCAVDLGGRSFLNFKSKFSREKVGEFPTELVEEFFRGVATGMKTNIYIRAKGKNDHHKIESIFKAFAKSLNEAFRFDERASNLIPSTKGVI